MSEVDATVHPMERTTPEEWAILNLADSWMKFDDEVRASQGGRSVVEASLCLQALQLAVREWRKARVYVVEAEQAPKYPAPMPNAPQFPSGERDAPAHASAALAGPCDDTGRTP